MGDKIDRKYITKEFLLYHFPSPDRFHEIMEAKDTLKASEKRYITFRENLNKERTKSRQPALSDADLAGIIKHAEGYLVLTRELKRNKQL